MLKMLSLRPQGVGGVMIIVAASIYMQSVIYKYWGLPNTKVVLLKARCLRIC